MKYEKAIYIRNILRKDSKINLMDTYISKHNKDTTDGEATPNYLPSTPIFSEQLQN
jgi:hypothetical protein